MKILADKEYYRHPRKISRRPRASVNLSFIAVSALANIGEKAIPALRQALRNPDPYIQTNAAEALQRITDKTGKETLTLENATELLRSNDAAAQETAISILARMGDDAIPMLVKAMEYENEQGRSTVELAQRHLLEKGKKAIPHLINAYGNKEDPRPYVDCRDVLVEMGEIAVPYLISSLSHPDPEMKSRVAFTLGMLEGKAAPAVPRLIQLLSEKEGYVRSNAAFALGKIGPSSVAAVPTLRNVLHHPESYVRSSAAEALGAIGEKAAEAVPSLIQALSDESQEVRISAAYALGHMREKAEAAVPYLAKGLTAENANVRSSVVSALGMIGPKAILALPWLNKALNDESSTVRENAVVALGQLGPEALPAIPWLLERLADANEAVRSTSRLVIKKMGSSALPHLEKALADEKFSSVHAEIKKIIEEIKSNENKPKEPNDERK